MDERDLVAVAARNNAEWCDAFCRTHGIAGRFDRDAWWSAERTPPFYPDAVTLARRTDAARILARVDVGAGCSIKDSFGDLDLTPDGFGVLFHAEWLVLARAAGPAEEWSLVRSQDELAKWESAWGEPPQSPPFFRPALLADEAIAIVASYDGDRIVAGAVANRSDAAIGLSNVFAVDGNTESAYAGAASAAQARWGAFPVVGYEMGESLAAAGRAGFVTVGELAVWVTV